jgi:hypothetical protein
MKMKDVIEQSIRQELARKYQPGSIDPQMLEIAMSVTDILIDYIPFDKWAAQGYYSVGYIPTRINLLNPTPLRHADNLGSVTK